MAAPSLCIRRSVFEQAKDLCWSYIKQYTDPIGGTRYLEGELACLLPNGAIIKLYGGAAAYERMRGMYFDGIVFDEYPLLNPAVFGTVVRPCLADYHGFALVQGPRTATTISTISGFGRKPIRAGTSSSFRYRQLGRRRYQKKKPSNSPRT